MLGGYVTAGIDTDPLEFTVYGLTNPESTAVIYFSAASFHVSGESYPIDKSTSTMFSLSFVTGLITILDIFPNDKEIGSRTATWTVIFQAEHILKPDYIIRLEFPKQI